jgi:hypothetical protein
MQCPFLSRLFFSSLVFFFVFFNEETSHNARAALRCTQIMANVCAPLAFYFLRKMTNAMPGRQHPGSQRDMIRFLSRLKKTPLFSSFLLFFPFFLFLFDAPSRVAGARVSALQFQSRAYPSFGDL